MKWIVLGLALTSCTSARYEPCPTLVSYSNTDQKELASEIRKSPQPQIIRWIGDYIGLRDQVRVCQK
ncbi:hypothetical protein M2305_002256 [Gluconobacter cerinus]|nr:hypothetical protein [Gluconobacter cerinus]